MVRGAGRVTQGEEVDHFVAAEHGRQGPRLFRRGNHVLERPRVLERDLIEKPERAHGDDEGTGRQLSLAGQIHLVRANLVGSQDRWRPAKVTGEPSDGLYVGALVCGERFRTCMSSSMRWRRAVMAGSLARGTSGAPIPGGRHDTLSEREKHRARQRANQRGAAETSTRIERPPPAKRVSPIPPIVFELLNQSAQIAGVQRSKFGRQGAKSLHSSIPVVIRPGRSSGSVDARPCSFR